MRQRIVIGRLFDGEALTLISQPVRSPLCFFRVCENRRHSRGLAWRAGVSLAGKFWNFASGLVALRLRSPFSNFRFGIPETGSICDGDRFAESISRLHRRQGGKMD